MKIGMNLLLWTTQVTEQDHSVLKRLKTIGFDGVEVPIFAGTQTEYKDLGKTLRDLGLDATAATILEAGTNPISPDKAIRQAAVDRLKWAIDRCVDSGAEVLCGPMHSALGVFSGEAPTKDEWQQGVETLRIAAEYAASAKVQLAIEYLNRFENYFMTTAADTFAWLEAINNPACGMMWDTFHAQIEEKNIVPQIKAIQSRMVHFHISENDRGTPGTGQVNWPETFRALHEVNYDRWLVIEAFGRSLPAIAAATKVWRDLFPDADQLCVEGLSFIKKNLAAKA